MWEWSLVSPQAVFSATGVLSSTRQYCVETDVVCCSDSWTRNYCALTIILCYSWSC